MRWANALVDISWGYLIFSLFSAKCFQVRLQNLKGLFPRDLPLGYLQREAAQCSGAQQETVESPAVGWRYREILSAKQAVAGFSEEKTWHIESGFWSNKDIKDVKYNTQKNRINIQNPLWRKTRGMNCLWSVKSQQKRQNLPSSWRLNRQSCKKTQLFLFPPLRRPF